MAGSAAAAWPSAGRAQGPSLPVVGYLSGASREESAGRVAGFRRGLEQAGLVDGRDLVIEYRWADGDYARLPRLADELVRKPVVVMMATGGPRAALAAKAATATLPIVFTMGIDPVTLGIVRSLSRPGGNVTGISFLTLDLVPKRFGLALELIPKARLVALIVNPNTPSSAAQVKATQEAARTLGRNLHVAYAGTAKEIDAAFSVLAGLRPDALMVGTDAFFATRREQFIAQAARQALPTIYEGRESVAAGGLMSYGPSIDEAHVQAGAYVGRILGGAKPADLPILQPTKFELVINLRTAKALGLTIPRALLLRADELIE